MDALFSMVLRISEAQKVYSSFINTILIFSSLLGIWLVSGLLKQAWENTALGSLPLFGSCLLNYFFFYTFV